MPDKHFKEKFLNSKSLGCSVIFNLFWVFLGSIIIWISINKFVEDYQEYTRLAREGVPSTATIVNLEIEQVRRKNRPPTSFYKVYYRYTIFTNESPVMYEDVENTSRSFYNSLEIGQEIEILYATSDPSISATKDKFELPSIIFVVVIFVVAGSFILMGLGSILQNIRAMS